MEGRPRWKVVWTKKKKTLVAKTEEDDDDGDEASDAVNGERYGRPGPQQTDTSRDLWGSRLRAQRGPGLSPAARQVACPHCGEAWGRGAAPALAGCFVEKREGLLQRSCQAVVKP